MEEVAQLNVKKLKKILDDKGIQQQDLAVAVGVSQAFISYVIKGFKEPSINVLKRMAEYLNVKVDELI